MNVLIVLANIVVVVLFALRKRKVLATVYALALVFLVTATLFPLDTPEGLAFWSSLFGGKVQECAPWILYYQDVQFSPFYGLEILSVVLAVVFILKTFDAAYADYARGKGDSALRRPAPTYAAPSTRYTPIEKKYMTYCALLC